MVAWNVRALERTWLGVGSELVGPHVKGLASGESVLSLGLV